MAYNIGDLVVYKKDDVGMIIYHEFVNDENWYKIKWYNNDFRSSHWQYINDNLLTLPSWKVIKCKTNNE